MDSSSLPASFQPLVESGVDKAVDIATMVIGAILLWMVGRMVIGMVRKGVARALDTRHVDPTLSRYVGSSLGVLLNIILVVAVLGVFGVETTTFAGLLAAAGVAIGLAWSGLLSNFAAGAFLMVLRPFKVGDFVEAGGITGTIQELGLFTTAIDTPDNVRTFLGNHTIFSNTIKNFSLNPHRRVDLIAQLAGGADHRAAITLLKQKLATIPNVMTTPAPEVDILEFNLVGPVLAVRPYCHTDHYWQVWFDSNLMIREALGAAGFPTPTPSMRVEQVQITA